MIVASDIVVGILLSVEVESYVDYYPVRKCTVVYVREYGN
jgi:hypothetical protein